MVKKNGHDKPSSNLPKSNSLAPPPEVIPNKPVAKHVKIFPETALNWLQNPDFNIMNRPIVQSRVNNWADIIKKGEWKCNGQGIIISDEGKLLDGQHRLWACVEAGVPFESYLLEGISKEVFDTLDVGKKRSATDILKVHNKIHGIDMKNENVVMAAIMTIIEYETGVWTHRHPHMITDHDKLQYLENNPKFVDWVKKARVKGTGRWENRHTANIAMVAYLGSKQSLPKAETFVAGFTTGNDLPVGSPIAALRNKLGTVTQKEKWERLRLIIYAFNLHVANETKIDLRAPAEMPVITGTNPHWAKRDKRSQKEVKRINVNPAIKRVKTTVRIKDKEAAEIAYIQGKQR